MPIDTTTGSVLAEQERQRKLREQQEAERKQREAITAGNTAANQTTGAQGWTGTPVDPNDPAQQAAHSPTRPLPVAPEDPNNPNGQPTGVFVNGKYIPPGTPLPGSSTTARDPENIANDTRNKLVSEYDNQTPRPAPVVGQTTLGATPTATAGSTGPAAQVNIPTVGPAAQVGNIPQVNAPTVGAPTIAPIERVTAPGLAPVATATAERAGAATVNRGEQDQIRQRQLALITSLEGGGPSAAELTAKRMAEEAISQQKSLVAGAHGTGRVGAMLKAQDNISSIGTKAARDAAIIRAQEEQQRRGQLIQALEGTRGTDVGLATTEAGFQQQSNLANAAAGTQVSIANMNAENAHTFKDADLKLAAAQGNQAAQNELNRRQAELTLAADTTSATLGVEAQKANQGAAVTTEVANMQAKNRLAEIEAQIKLQGGIANAEQQNEMAKLNAQLQTQTSIANTQEAGAGARAQLSADTQVALANADNELKSRGLDDQQRRALLDAVVSMRGQDLTHVTAEEMVEVARQNANTASTDSSRQFWGTIIGGILGGGASIGAAALKSDARAKSGIKPLYSDERGKTGKAALVEHYDGGGEGEGEVEALLAKIRPVSFKYKDPSADGAAPGKRYGVLAQDLEKSPMGKSLVIDDNGVKKIDTGQAVGALLAAMSRMNSRVKKVEGRR